MHLCNDVYLALVTYMCRMYKNVCVQRHETFKNAKCDGGEMRWEEGEMEPVRTQTEARNTWLKIIGSYKSGVPRREVEIRRRQGQSIGKPHNTYIPVSIRSSPLSRKSREIWISRTRFRDRGKNALYERHRR